MICRGILFFTVIYTATLSALIVEYEKPNTTSETAWEAVQPYLLPFNAPIRKTLDEIFSTSRVTADRESFTRAGFRLTPDQGLHVVVASHKELEGFLVKVIFDQIVCDAEDPLCDAPDLGEDWEQWIRRIQGERIIREGIAKLDYKKYFKVPFQWIYPLPNGPEAPQSEGYYPRSFIFIAEDMQLASPDHNTRFYKKMDKSLIKAIFTITTQYGLEDCCNKFNLPLCEDGKLAFIDTETFYQWPVNYHRMVEFISSTKHKYWNKLKKKRELK